MIQHGLDPVIGKDADSLSAGGDIQLPVIHIDQKQNSVFAASLSEPVVVIKIVCIVHGTLAHGCLCGHHHDIQSVPGLVFFDGLFKLFCPGGSEKPCHIKDALLVRALRRVRSAGQSAEGCQKTP